MNMTTKLLNWLIRQGDKARERILRILPIPNKKTDSELWLVERWRSGPGWRQTGHDWKLSRIITEAQANEVKKAEPHPKIERAIILCNKHMIWKEGDK